MSKIEIALYLSPIAAFMLIGVGMVLALLFERPR